MFFDIDDVALEMNSVTKRYTNYFFFQEALDHEEEIKSGTGFKTKISLFYLT